MVMFDKYKIVLVSKSPRRIQLLKELGLDFITDYSDANETFPTELTKGEIPLFLSKLKANTPSKVIEDNSLIIAADTIVWVNNKAIGKPRDKEEAKNMLHELSGKSHYVYTGVTLKTKLKEHSFFVETEVVFSELTDSEINYYVETYQPLDKAGAYGIQDWIGLIGVKAINGSYHNVMGLPVARLYKELKLFTKE